MTTTKTSPSKKMIRDRLHFEILPGEVAYKRITQQLRDLILSKVLTPGTRLPTLAELSVLWNTNYYTVQTALTPLVNEGLLMRKQRSGTFVAENTPQIKAVGIYFGGNLWQVKHAAFYQALYAALCDHFERLGIVVHFFMDTRPRAKQGTPWKPLLAAIERSEVNAVVAAMTIPEQYLWLDKLPVPFSGFGGAGTHSSIDLGMKKFLLSSLERLKERNCHSVALIIGPGVPGVDSFVELAAKVGLESRPEWVFKRDTWPEEYEEFGFEAFEKLWSRAAKPDGLIIYPDNIALGVIMSILQKGVQVPDELKLLMHCNEEVYIPCPLAADWQVVSIVTIVERLWKSLLAQADGKVPRKSMVELSLQPASAELPPMLRKWRSGGSLFLEEGSKLS